jgi:hypothetical protein
MLACTVVRPVARTTSAATVRTASTCLAVLERRGDQTRLIRRVGHTGISRRPARCAYRGIGLPYKTQPK